MKTHIISQLLRRTALSALAVTIIAPSTLRAADHRDGPTNAHDAATDLADCYFFQDPDPARPNHLVVIATFHGFIVPGEAANEAIFDHVVNYRFEFYNNHVNAALPVDPGSSATLAQRRAFALARSRYLASIVPARIIDVRFSPRVAIPATQVGKEILQVPLAQTATVFFSGFRGVAGFTGNNLRDRATGLAVLNPGLGAASPTPPVSDIPAFTTGGTPPDIKFFAGETDDPFFFDIPAFGRTVGGIRAGTLPADFATNPSFLGRGRDTFAGYNILSIAFSIPKAALADVDTTKTKIGLNVMAQRRTVQTPNSRGSVNASGSFRAVDREGNPAINVALIPFNRKNEYNASRVVDDARGKFVGDIVATLQALNPAISPATLGALAGVAVNRGDVLTLDTAVPAAWPASGRKPTDDVIDAALSTIFETTLGDSVSGNDVPFSATFPYLGATQQPRDPVPGTDPDLVDDNTQN
jgi:hypothetical protein